MPVIIVDQLKVAVVTIIADCVLYHCSIHEACHKICRREHLRNMHCEHGLMMCLDCGNLWDGNAQCLCFMDAL